mgnify:CR=1 FL=1
MNKQNVESNLFEKKNEEGKDLLPLRLLKPHKTIRDAVHGDVMLTDLEVNIIDTDCFQRLRGIRQLGTAHMVYPCAMHTRFDHAIGCLHVAEGLINRVNNNPYSDIKIDLYDRFLIRLTALLHDLAHVPFGHTLEDEGTLFKSQWNDEIRAEIFLGDQSVVGKIILQYEILQQLSNAGQSQFKSTNVLKSLQEVIQAIEKHTVESLPRPYIGDIIGNTLCADLLDYIRRDLYFTGLDENYDDRFLSYLYVTNYERKPRLVLRLHKPSTKRIRRDVQSELLHLLRLRYSLAEKVYFHHTKISSSAMVISAVTDMFHENKINTQKFYPMSDDTLIEFMKNDGTEVAKRLMHNLSKHKLFKPVYGLKFGGESGEDPHYTEKQQLRELLAKKELRWTAERSLEKQNELSPGSIVIYCPGEGMGYKAVKALVNLDGENIGPLDNVAPQRVKDEIKSSITQKHKELWCMYVFVDRDLPEDAKANVHGDCEKMFKLQSDVEDCRVFYNPRHLHYLLRFEDKFVRENFGMTQLGAREVLSMAARPKEHPISEEVAEYSSLSYDEYSSSRKNVQI